MVSRIFIFIFVHIAFIGAVAASSFIGFEASNVKASASQFTVGSIK